MQYVLAAGIGLMAGSLPMLLRWLGGLWLDWRYPPRSALPALLEANRDRGVRVWCSSFTVWDDNGLPRSGGGVTLADGTVLAGETLPDKSPR